MILIARKSQGWGRKEANEDVEGKEEGDGVGEEARYWKEEDEWANVAVLDKRKEYIGWEVEVDHGKGREGETKVNIIWYEEEAERRGGRDEVILVTERDWGRHTREKN